MDIFAGLACFVILFALGLGFCLRSWVQVGAYLLAFLGLSSLMVVVHLISLDMGREGFSIFVKNGLVDDQLYHVTATHLAEFWFKSEGSIQDIYNKQVALFGYSSGKSIYFAALAAPVYYLFGSNVLYFKFLIVLFSALTIAYLARDTYQRIGKQSLVFVLSFFVLSYPTFFIRSVQVEKDTFLLFLFLVAFVQLYRIVSQEPYSKTVLALVAVGLALYRPQYSLTLLLAVGYVRFLLPRSKWIFLLQAGIFAMVIPLPILLLKSINSGLFELLVAIKRYSVLAGVTNVIEVDYSSYFGILKTVSISLYYFLFAPISIYALKGGLMWALMIVEPLIWFVLPVAYVVRNHRYSPNFRPKLFFILAITIIVALLSVYYESHVGSYMRKRMPVYFVWTYFAVMVYIDKYQAKLTQRLGSMVPVSSRTSELKNPPLTPQGG